MSENLFPIAKLLTPDDKEPYQFVTLGEFEWWNQVTPMETASRQRLLRCPICDGEFLYAHGPVKGGYFRHRRESCAGPGRRGSLNGGDAYPPAQTMWTRYEFAQLLRRVLPAGSQVDEKDALLRLDGHIRATLPDGQQVAVEVDCHPAGFRTWAERAEQHARSGAVVVWVFSGALLTPQIARAGTNVSTRLDPLPSTIMQRTNVGRPKAVDYLSRAYQSVTMYPFYTAQGQVSPHSLLFYERGREKGHLGTLVALRGILPGPKDVWGGAVVRAEVVAGKPHSVRYSPNRGLFLTQDVSTLRSYRLKQQNVRRHERVRLEQEAALRHRTSTVNPHQHQEAVRPVARNVGPATAPLPRSRSVNPAPAPAPNQGQLPLCTGCGRRTNDWVSKQGDTCLCRACSFRRKGTEPKFCAKCGGVFPPNYPFKDGLCMDCR